jgi:hypothetical protein
MLSVTTRFEPQVQRQHGDWSVAVATSFVDDGRLTSNDQHIAAPVALVRLALDRVIITS